MLTLFEDDVGREREEHSFCLMPKSETARNENGLYVVQIVTVSTLVVKFSTQINLCLTTRNSYPGISNAQARSQLREGASLGSEETILPELVFLDS